MIILLLKPVVTVGLVFLTRAKKAHFDLFMEIKCRGRTGGQANLITVVEVN